MELVAEGGVKALTARAVADRSGLSQGLIRHHYGSMAELLRACDAHIAEVIRASKRESITPSPSFDAIGALGLLQRAAADLDGRGDAALDQDVGVAGPGAAGFVQQRLGEALQRFGFAHARRAGVT